MARSLQVSAALLLATTAASASEVEYGPFEVAAVEVVDFAGELDVRARSGGSVHIALKGTPDDISTFAVNLEGGRLVLSGPRRSSSPTVLAGEVKGYSGGGEAMGVIAGTPTGWTSAPPPKLALDLPPGTALEITNVAGDVRVGDLAAPLALTLAAGSASIGRVHETRVDIRGSGEVRVAEVANRLEIAINGSGLVEAGAGRVDSFSATISGAGDIRFGGTARRAQASITGAGTIAIHEVLEAPEISVLGAGKVEIARRP